MKINKNIIISLSIIFILCSCNNKGNTISKENIEFRYESLNFYNYELTLSKSRIGIYVKVKLINNTNEVKELSLIDSVKGKINGFHISNFKLSINNKSYELLDLRGDYENKLNANDSLLLHLQIIKDYDNVNLLDLRNNNIKLIDTSFTVNSNKVIDNYVKLNSNGIVNYYLDDEKISLEEVLAMVNYEEIDLTK